MRNNEDEDEIKVPDLSRKKTRTRITVRITQSLRFES